MVGHCNLTHKSIPTTIKFLCSYGGKILPRYPDGKLRYQGGETRVLAVDRSISFSELLVKLGEMCRTSVLTLRCQLPTEDLDALISITSDEDLANLIEEYDRAAAGTINSTHKIRAFLSNPTKYSTPKSLSPSSSISSISQTSNYNYDTTTTPTVMSPKSYLSSSPVPTLMSKSSSSRRPTVLVPPTTGRCIHQMASRQPVKLIPQPFYNNYEKVAAGKLPRQYAYCPTSTPPAGKTGHMYLIHNGNHWQ